MAFSLPPPPEANKIVLRSGQVIDTNESGDLTLENLKKVAAEACEAAHENRAAIERLKKAPDSGQLKRGKK